ncbi:type II and III secretion system protein family protein [Pelodictyon luteolum]|uniref:Type II secretion system protein n=1 Tax=Chlorobium luteolum (strain DSM 273 / BCRC 81028 / 2530) TaxID=319225 RepID=Q3B4R0_CHLL3|nr:pilus assembly protein N-terminal domain-containing protein [Pelodictyon luteolum]ABB23671.1 type II secretion system protein [Pelodictyon luteolum DSM 273]
MQMKIPSIMRSGCRASTLAALLAATAPAAGSAYVPPYRVPVGESRVYRLPQPVTRVAVGDPEVADYIMLNPSEIYLLGKKTGSTNLTVWDRKGKVSSRSLRVSRNVAPIQELLRVVLPGETGIQLYASGHALVLSGSASDAMAADTAYRLVIAYSGGTVPALNPESALLAGSAGASGSVGAPGISGIHDSAPAAPSALPGAAASRSPAARDTPRVVNLLKIRDPQQVRLEVRIAEVSRSHIESLGIGWTQGRGSTQGSLMTGFVSNATLDLLLKTGGMPGSTEGNRLTVDAEQKKGLVKILAEPTIVAMSGEEGYFLVGGKVYTPTLGTNGSVDYVERTYGVGLRCTPTVLDSGRISLKVAPEVSEPLKEAVTAGTSTSLPAFKLSYASTTVQMQEGENLVIGGLLRDNLTEVKRSVPLLSSIPVLGSLFRHTEMNKETTELMVIVRPTLVKAGNPAPELPTDRFVPPAPLELFIEGKLDGSGGAK